jgi:hypothetical protein
MWTRFHLLGDGPALRPEATRRPTILVISSL